MLLKTVSQYWLVSVFKRGPGAIINSSPPSATYMCQWTGSALFQVMACRLFGAKPLPEPVLAYCQLESWEQISVNFESEFYHSHSRKYIWKCRLLYGDHFVQGEMSWRKKVQCSDVMWAVLGSLWYHWCHFLLIYQARTFGVWQLQLHSVRNIHMIIYQPLR